MSTRLNFQRLFYSFQGLSLSKSLGKSFGDRFVIASSTAAIASMLSISAVAPVHAATINRNFVGGDRPVTSSGNGNLNSIFDTAATYWENAILDDLEFSIDFGWTRLPETTLAEFTPLTTTGNPQRTAEGAIFFNTNNRLFEWFLDETPSENEEFGRFTAASNDFGGGEINTGRIYDDPNEVAAGRFDLLTIAVHELGHAFGILNFYETFDEETFDDDDIDIRAPLPFAGSQLPTTPINGGHLDIDTAALAPFFEPGRRTLLSEADIVAAAASSGSSQLNLNPQPSSLPRQTSEASNLAMLSLLASLGWLRRQPRRLPQTPPNP